MGPHGVEDVKPQSYLGSGFAQEGLMHSVPLHSGQSVHAKLGEASVMQQLEAGVVNGAQCA